MNILPKNALRNQSLLFLLLIIFIAWLYISPPIKHFLSLISHDDGYFDIGRNLYQYSIYSLDGINSTALRVPLYPLICLLFIKIFGVSSGMIGLFLLNRLFLFMGVYLCFYAVKKTLNLFSAWLVVILFLINPYFYEHGYALTQTAGAFFLTNLFLFSLSFSNVISRFLKSNFIRFFIFGCALGISTLFRQTFLVISIFVCVWIVFYYNYKRGILFLLGFIISMSPWWIRNAYTFNRFVLTDTGVSSLVVGCYNSSVFSEMKYAEMGWVEKDIHKTILAEEEWGAYDKTIPYVIGFLKEQKIFRIVHVYSLKLLKHFYPYCHVSSGSLWYVPLMIFFLTLNIGAITFLLSAIKDIFVQKNTIPWWYSPVLSFCIVTICADISLAFLFYSYARLSFPFTPCYYILGILGVKQIYYKATTQISWRFLNEKTP